MWWPAIGGVVVGGVGILSPHTMGVGYDNIDRILSGDLAGQAVVVFCALKFVSWALSLGTGTSGGTLAPLFTIGGGLGSGARRARRLGAAGRRGRRPRRGARRHGGALRGRFARAARVGRLRVRDDPPADEPLAAARRVHRGLSRLGALDAALDHDREDRAARRRASSATTRPTSSSRSSCADIAAAPVVVLKARDTCESVREWIASHSEGSDHRLSGGRRRRPHRRRGHAARPARRGLPAARVQDLVKRPPAIVFEDSSLREASDHMVREGVGRLPVRLADRSGAGRRDRDPQRPRRRARPPHRRRAAERTRTTACRSGGRRLRKPQVDRPLADPERMSAAGARSPAAPDTVCCAP